MKHIFKKNLAKRIVPLCSVLLLSACATETKDEFRAQSNLIPENPGRPDFVDKGGLTGRVITDKYIAGAVVCFDENKNGFCDLSEAREESFENGAFSFSKAISDTKQNTTLIAQISITIPDNSADSGTSTQKIVLSANQVDSNQPQMITPFTTLVVNEQLYNPYANANQTDAISYLAGTNLVGKPLLEGEDYIASNNATAVANATHLVDAFTQAFSIKESDPFFAIANVVDKVVKTKNLEISLDSLNPQNRLDQNLSLTDLDRTTSWVKLDDDETGMGSRFAKDVKKVVSYSKWHNKLTILDSSNVNVAPIILDSDKFLFVDDIRDAVDANTGASEQELTQLKVTNDGNTIYSMLTKYKDDSKNIGVGAYISDISSSTIPTTIFATESNLSHFYHYEDITDIALSPDNTIFGVSGNDKKIILFDAGNLSSPTHDISSSKRVKSITISQDNSLVFAGLSKKFDNSLGIFSVLTKDLLGEFSLDKHPTVILQINENEIFVASNDDNKIFHLDISDKSNIKQVALLTATEKVKDLSLSNDGQYLISTLSLKQVNAFDLTNTSKVAAITLDDVVVSAFDVNENTIAITYGTNISYFNLIESDSSNLTDIEKQAWENEHRK